MDQFPHDDQGERPEEETMSYELKNGKLEKSMPKDDTVGVTLKYHVIAEVTVRATKTDDTGNMKIVDAQLAKSRLATHPDDKVTKEELGQIMFNSDALTELAGVLLVEQIHRKRNPLVVPSTGAEAKGRGPGGTDG